MLYLLAFFLKSDYMNGYKISLNKNVCVVKNSNGFVLGSNLNATSWFTYKLKSYYHVYFVPER